MFTLFPANFPEDVVDALPDDFATGIYYGWAEVDGDVYKMVMSVGWNPFYKNEKRSMVSRSIVDVYLDGLVTVSVDLETIQYHVVI